MITSKIRILSVAAHEYPYAVELPDCEVFYVHVQVIIIIHVLITYFFAILHYWKINLYFNKKSENSGTMYQSGKAEVHENKQKF